MTLQSYLDANNLSKQGLADVLGVSYHVVYRACMGYEPRKKENLEKFLSLGVTFQKNEAPREHIVRGRKKGVSSQDVFGFMEQERLATNMLKQDDIWCWNVKHLNEITEYLNERRIDYYVRYYGDCWRVRYDRKARC